MQNVNIHMDAHTDGWTNGQLYRKTKTIYPLTYFVGGIISHIGHVMVLGHMQAVKTQISLHNHAD